MLFIYSIIHRVWTTYNVIFGSSYSQFFSCTKYILSKVSFKQNFQAELCKGHEILFVLCKQMTEEAEKLASRCVIVRQNQNYEQTPRTSQFSVLTIGRIFPKKISCRIFDQVTNFYQKMFLEILICKILYFQKLCPIFVGSVHTFGKSYDDKIW